MLFCVLFFAVLVSVLVVVSDLCFMDELHAKNKHNRLMEVEGDERTINLCNFYFLSEGARAPGGEVK